MNVLVVRADRIGDVVLSTPVFRALKQARPDARVTALVREPVRPILERLDSIDELLVFEPGLDDGARGIARLVAALRRHRFDAAVALQSNPAIAWATLLARIPVRVGPLSKAHSFITYNRGVRQRRSNVERHEAEYNLQLLEPLGIRMAPRTVFPEIAITTEARERALGWLERHGWTPGSCWIAIHPGMGGSALNWSMDRYVELADKLRRQGRDVIVTTGPGEDPIAARFTGVFPGTVGPDRAGLPAYVPGAGEGVDVLAALYERMAVVIAPSTGPLHVAAAAGTPVVGLYSNLRVQSPARWGPYVADPHQAIVFEPPVDCGSDPNCMATIATDDVAAAVTTLIERRIRG